MTSEDAGRTGADDDASGARALVVDDDPDIRESLEWRLSTMGFDTTSVETGVAAIAAVRDDRVDAVVLDLRLPDLDGIEVLRRIREMDGAAVVLLLSGQSDEIDRVLALELGADAFLQKPCGPREVAAALKSLLRRKRQSPPESARTPTLDPTSRTATLEGTIVDLTESEFALLELMSGEPGRVWDHGEILNHVWGPAADERSPSSVAELVRRLRLKLDPAGPGLVVTVRGRGYSFRLPT